MQKVRMQHLPSSRYHNLQKKTDNDGRCTPCCCSSEHAQANDIIADKLDLPTLYERLQSFVRITLERSKRQERHSSPREHNIENTLGSFLSEIEQLQSIHNTLHSFYILPRKLAIPHLHLPQCRQAMSHYFQAPSPAQGSPCPCPCCGCCCCC
jgi:hypothetical protein